MWVYKKREKRKKKRENVAFFVGACGCLNVWQGQVVSCFKNYETGEAC